MLKLLLTYSGKKIIFCKKMRFKFMKNYPKHIRVDMDHHSEPVWFGEDGESFINGSLEELPITDELKGWMDLYKDLWEKSIGKAEIKDEEISLKHGLGLTVKRMSIKIAERLKVELPDSKIYIWDEDSSTNKLM